MPIPFFVLFVCRSDYGGGNGFEEYLPGTTGSGATESSVFTFKVPADAPALLYYQCYKQKCMGYKIHIVNKQITDNTLEDKTPIIPTFGSDDDRDASPQPLVLTVAPSMSYRPPPQYNAAKKMSALQCTFK